MEEEIKIINKIIAEAVCHGADAGGSYDQNAYNLITAINQWLIFKGWANRYTVEETIAENEWHTYQIVPITNIVDDDEEEDDDDLSWLKEIDY